MDDAERMRIEAEFLAGVVGELENNTTFEQQYREMVPALRDRMAAILDRYAEPRDAVEEDIVCPRTGSARRAGAGPRAYILGQRAGA
jgi:hypothetical protein